MWCDLYRDDCFEGLIRTNNGIERQNECLKYDYLQGYKNCALSEFLNVLVNQFLPDAYLT